MCFKNINLQVLIFSLQLPIFNWPAFQNGKVSDQLFIVTISVFLQDQFLTCFKFLGTGYTKPVQTSSSTSTPENKFSNNIMQCLELTKNGLKFKNFIKQGGKNRSQGSIISIVNRLCAGWSWVQTLTGASGFFFSSPQCWYHLCGPLSLLFSGYWELFPAGKVVRCAADHSCLTSADVKNEWSYISTSLYAWMLCTHRALPFFFKKNVYI